MKVMVGIGHPAHVHTNSLVVQERDLETVKENIKEIICLD